MDRLLIVLLGIVVFSSACGTDFEDASEKVKHVKSESTKAQKIKKDITIEVFEKGESIGQCDVRVELSQTVVGNDSIWVISDLNEGIAKKSGFYFYSAPEEVNYLRTNQGYDIQLILECQLAELGAQLEDEGVGEISFIETYDALNDNELTKPQTDDLISIQGQGTLCTSGEYVRLIKTIYIQQKVNELIIEQKELKVVPSSNSNWRDFDFLETNNVPTRLTFEKSAGYTPIIEIRSGEKRFSSRKSSKYDSSAIFK